ncbi:MAG: hypothetical protein K6A33_00460, partial [Clostridiales bacterium]|nr:hypothetical protein [Clostridiales bacterium]
STAAYTRGIRTLLIPKDNMRDIPELDPNVVREMTFLPCETLTDVLSRALRHPEYEERLPVVEGIETADTKTASILPPMGEPARYNRI